ncbi:uncharacterized protein LOC123527462 isoform X3 [Mercenaria mercenaria]|uniref:uncharacterized protein LOC123527462 isoform X3 n=1 Tax=Mercenaria mercenaria TaxID=6596 RepID=UPI00234F86E9|nr:uncharacterized protein LOC123527462 isoform X3 [Mercenaria mercenaria]
MSASLISVPYVRPAVLIRSLKHQLSCLSIRGIHNHSRETTSSQECFVLHSGPFSYHQPMRTKETNSVPSSTKQTLSSQITQKYRFLNGSVTDIIADNVRPNLKYDCPKLTNVHTEISTPSVIKIIPILPIDDPGTSHIEKDSPGTSTLEKLANKGLMKVRRRKMKKHQRKRMKARIWPMLRKQRFQKEKKKKKILDMKLEAMRKIGEDYDALEEVKNSLRIAKTKGYYFNIFSEKSKTFGFADVLKQKKQ